MDQEYGSVCLDANNHKKGGEGTACFSWWGNRREVWRILALAFEQGIDGLPSWDKTKARVTPLFSAAVTAGFSSPRTGWIVALCRRPFRADPSVSAASARRAWD